MGILPIIPPITAPKSLPIGYIEPPTNSLLPKAVSVGLLAISIPVLAVQVIGVLGGDKWRDDLLAKVSGNKGGNSSTFPSTNDLNDLPNTVEGYEALRNDDQWVGSGSRGFTLEEIKQLIFYPNDATAIAKGHVLPNGVTIQTYFKAVRPVGSSKPTAFTGNASPSGLRLTDVPRFSEGLENSNKPILTPNLSSAIGFGATKPIDGRAALGFGSPTTDKPKLSPAPVPLGSNNPFSLQPPTPSKTDQDKQSDKQKTEQEKVKEQQKQREEETKKALAALKSDNSTVLQELTRIGAISALINSNTSPEAQRLNAKNGSCDALNSPSCSKGMEDRIKDPIFGKLDAAQVVRDGIAANQLLEFGKISGNFTKVKSFLDNTVVDRAIGAANFAMNVHNALMLSNNLAKTVAGVIDTAMTLTPFQFTDATTGQRTTVLKFLNQNVSSFLVNLIGQDLFTELSDDWKVANRIYQSSTNLLNKTERLLSGQSKIAQKSGIDVANIGNALRANGIVNPNSYPPMAATKEANTPTELLTDVNSPLSSIQSGIKNLNTVTKSVSGSVKQVSAIQKEFGKLQALTDKESKVRKSLRSQSASQAKRKAKFTLLQIKTIKQSGKR
jgi:hypothetical protein